MGSEPRIGDWLYLGDSPVTVIAVMDGIGGRKAIYIPGHHDIGSTHIDNLKPNKWRHEMLG